MKQFRVIETRYKGYQFRSRLEARWAVFFDALGIPFIYEPEGYQLDGMFYLPDFWLPEHNYFIEIKGAQPNEEESQKASLLCEFTKRNVYIFFGDIPDAGSLDKDGNDSSYLHCCYELDGEWNQGWDNYHLWCECPHCSKLEIQFDGRADRIRCGCPKSSHGDKGYNHSSERLLAAYDKARGFRF